MFSIFENRVGGARYAVGLYFLAEEAVVHSVEGFGEIKDDNICLDSVVDVLGQLVDKLDKLAFTLERLARKPCWFRTTTLCCSQCTMILDTKTCSRILQQMHVREMGR